MGKRIGLGTCAALGLAVAWTGCTRAATKARPSKPGAVSALEAAHKKNSYATLVTSRGSIVVRLLPDQAPKAVANFVGLATGGKPWIDPVTGKKVERPLYNGTLFFRVIPGFMIQGGDPLNNGFGGPGYQFSDEITSTSAFNHAGVVAMANFGPDTNGSQFFITLAPAPWLGGKHTIFGEVIQGLETAQAIAQSPRAVRDPSMGRFIDRPVEPQILEEVRVEER